MTRIILVRHGETVWNVEMKYQGQTDIELTANGREQAKKVAARLAKEKIDVVYASDLSRARVTAEEIAKRQNLPVMIVPEFREISFGEWEGLTYNSINTKWPEQMNKFYTLADELEIPGGETFRQVKERALAALKKIVDSHPDKTLAIVSHGGTIRTILCAVMNIHLNHLWTIQQFNTAVNIINYYNDDKVLVELVNDVHHLVVDYEAL